MENLQIIFLTFYYNKEKEQEAMESATSTKKLPLCMRELSKTLIQNERTTFLFSSPLFQTTMI